MARKRHLDEEALKLPWEKEVHLLAGSDVPSACRQARTSDATDYMWRKKFGRMGRSHLSALRAPEKDNKRLKESLAELEPDKLILKERLCFFRARGLTVEELRQAAVLLGVQGKHPWRNLLLL